MSKPLKLTELKLNKEYFYIEGNHVHCALIWKRVEQVIPGDNYGSSIRLTLYRFNSERELPDIDYYETKKEATEKLIEILRESIND